VKFLRIIDREVPAELTIHLIVDNYATHKRPTVRARPGVGMHKR
jgi:hypothetical protein